MIALKVGFLCTCVGRQCYFQFAVYYLQLAANANDMIAMTDDEKKRLQELLVDIDALPELPEEGVDVSVSHPLLLATFQFLKKSSLCCWHHTWLD